MLGWKSRASEDKNICDLEQNMVYENFQKKKIFIFHSWKILLEIPFIPKLTFYVKIFN